MDINKMVLSDKVSLGKKGFKYFIGYKDAKKNQTSMYISSKNEGILKTKYVSFQIKNNELENLEKHNEIWEKTKNSIEKEFDSEPVCNRNI